MVRPAGSPRPRERRDPPRGGFCSRAAPVAPHSPKKVIGKKWQAKRHLVASSPASGGEGGPECTAAGAPSEGSPHTFGPPPPFCVDPPRPAPPDCCSGVAPDRAPEGSASRSRLELGQGLGLEGAGAEDLRRSRVRRPGSLREDSQLNPAPGPDPLSRPGEAEEVLQQQQREGEGRDSSGPGLGGAAPGRSGGRWARGRARRGAHNMDIPGAPPPSPIFGPVVGAKAEHFCLGPFGNTPERGGRSGRAGALALAPPSAGGRGQGRAPGAAGAEEGTGARAPGRVHPPG